MSIARCYLLVQPILKSMSKPREAFLAARVGRPVRELEKFKPSSPTDSWFLGCNILCHFYTDHRRIATRYSLELFERVKISVENFTRKGVRTTRRNLSERPCALYIPSMTQNAQVCIYVINSQTFMYGHYCVDLIYRVAYRPVKDDGLNRNKRVTKTYLPHPQHLYFPHLVK